jgi:hypothetical protein
MVGVVDRILKIAMESKKVDVSNKKTIFLGRRVVRI